MNDRELKEIARMNRAKHRERMKEWRDDRRDNTEAVLQAIDKLCNAIGRFKSDPEVNPWLRRAIETALASLDYLALRLESEAKLTSTQILKKVASEKR